MTDTDVPSGPLNVSTLASSCLASALTMPVPSPVFDWAKTPFDFPIPLSTTESFQSVPETSNSTVIRPSLVSLLNACLTELMTSSVTINPKLSASRQETLPSSLCTFSEIDRLSPIIECESASQSFERYGPSWTGPLPVTAWSCCCTAATDMTLW